MYCQERKYFYLQVEASHQPSSNIKFNETKSLMIGTGQTLVMIVFALTCLLPAWKARTIARKDIKDINSGSGRLMVYVGRMAMQGFVNFVIPFLFLVNSKMRKTLLREAKDQFMETQLASWCVCHGLICPNNLLPIGENNWRGFVCLCIRPIICNSVWNYVLSLACVIKPDG